MFARHDRPVLRYAKGTVIVDHLGSVGFIAIEVGGLTAVCLNSRVLMRLNLFFEATQEDNLTLNSIQQGQTARRSSARSMELDTRKAISTSKAYELPQL